MACSNVWLRDFDVDEGRWSTFELRGLKQIFTVSWTTKKTKSLLEKARSLESHWIFWQPLKDESWLYSGQLIWKPTLWALRASCGHSWSPPTPLCKPRTFMLSSLQRDTTYGRRAFSYAGPHAWNLLPENMRNLTSMAIFKRSLKTFLFEQITHSAH